MTDPEIDWDEMVTVVYGAGTNNEYRVRMPRYMIPPPVTLSAFVDYDPDAEASR